MKAQTVKNAVIVPVGAKGGFVVKRGDSKSAYETLIRGLLELTDNRVADGGGTSAIVPPPGVVRLDDDDSYLVVAADKGTGAFSDVANALSEEYGYWLGDAFASGGSAGFDHKEMGITSRGCLDLGEGALPLARGRRRHRTADRRRHRRHVGRRLRQRAPAVPHVQLVAAFDHRHVFVDPAPDPAASFAERQRLFALPDVVVGRLRPRGAVTRWRGLRPQREVGRPVGGSAARARPRRRAAHPRRVGERGAACAGRPAVERRDRDLREGDDRVRRRRRRPRQRHGADRCARAAVPGRGRRRQPRVHATGTDRIRARRRTDQHRRHRQLRRRRLLRPRGEHQDPAAARHRHRRARGERARCVARRDDRRGGRTSCSPTTRRRRTRWRSPRSRRPTWSGCTPARWSGSNRPQGSTARSKRSPRPRCMQERHAAGQGLTSPELAVLLAYTKLELQRALVASDVPDDPYLARGARRLLPPATAHRVRRRARRRTRCGARSSPPWSPTRW